MNLNLDNLIGWSPTANHTVNNSDRGCGLRPCTSERLPDDLFIGTESLCISEEGIISNIVEWFRKKKAEREARRKAESKRQWQAWINESFGDYLDWLESIDPKRLNSKEIDVYRYEDLFNIVKATIKVSSEFEKIDPLKYTSMVQLLAKIRSALTGQKNFYLDESDDLNFDPKASRPTVMFKSSKWSSLPAVKTLQTETLKMDELDWKVYDLQDRIVSEFNTKLKDSSDPKVRDIRKCCICWLNFTDFISNMELGTVKAIVSSMNNIHY